MNKNPYIQVLKVLVESNQRRSKIPQDTQDTAYSILLKGYLVEASKEDGYSKILTLNNRLESGFLFAFEPRYNHSFGNFIPEILRVREIILDEMKGLYNVE